MDVHFLIAKMHKLHELNTSLYHNAQDQSSNHTTTVPHHPWTATIWNILPNAILHSHSHVLLCMQWDRKEYLRRCLETNLLYTTLMQGIQRSGSAFALHVKGPGFDPRYLQGEFLSQDENSSFLTHYLNVGLFQIRNCNKNLVIILLELFQELH